MAQHDYSIANQGFPATRADINNVLSAIATNNSGTSAPTNQYAGQFWIDTTSSTWTLYIHDGSDDIQFATIDTSANTVNFIDSELGDNSVTTAKIADGNVTSAKLSYPLTTFSSTGIDDNATSTAITINSSENVGIGTSSPDPFKFHAKQGTGMGSYPTWESPSGRNIALFENSENESQVIIGSPTDGYGLLGFADPNFKYSGSVGYSHSGDYMRFATNGSNERMRIDSSGKVGIGETSMDALLVIKGNSDSSTTPSIRLKDGSDTREAIVSNESGDLVLATMNSSDNVIDSALTIYTSQMIFKVDGTNRISIDSNGYTKHSTTGSYDTYSGADDSHQFVSNNTGHSTLWITNQNASYDSGVLRVETNRGASSGFQFLSTTSDNLGDDQHRLRGDGNAYADGSWNGGGADYAEYFEWSDGNTSNEDRVGYSVVLEGDKIRKTTDTDNASNIIGVISGNPFVVGDTSWNKWSEKYLRDDFGRYIWEEYTVTEWKEEITEGEETKTIKKSFETDKIPSDEIVPNDATIISQETNGDNLKRRKLNPNYDETLEYIPREDRKEWSTVGLLGKVRIRKAQPVKDTWIKMRDISETVEEWLIK